MTCAKTQVRCEIHLANGKTVVRAENACANPQAECPRQPGEGYEKCKTVCNQQGHAEVQALRVASDFHLDLTGAHAVITGHTYACMDCQHALFGAGVKSIEVRK